MLGKDLLARHPGVSPPSAAVKVRLIARSGALRLQQALPAIAAPDIDVLYLPPAQIPDRAPASAKSAATGDRAPAGLSELGPVAEKAHDEPPGVGCSRVVRQGRSGAALNRESWAVSRRLGRGSQEPSRDESRYNDASHVAAGVVTAALNAECPASVAARLLGYAPSTSAFCAVAMPRLLRCETRSRWSLWKRMRLMVLMKLLPDQSSICGGWFGLPPR